MASCAHYVGRLLDEMDAVEQSGIVCCLTQQNEFAKASHIIDAASKIYGYRVDSAQLDPSAGPGRRGRRR